MGKEPHATFGIPQARLFDEVRDQASGTIMVVGQKDGKPYIWSNADERNTQQLLATVFPSATLPKQLAESDQR